MTQERIFKYWHYVDSIQKPFVVIDDQNGSVVGEFPLDVGEVAIVNFQKHLYQGTDGADGAFFLNLIDGSWYYLSDSQDLSFGDTVPFLELSQEPLPFDPDTELELSITALTPSQAEGDSGTTAFEFEVTRAGGDTTQALEVDYQVGGDIDGADIDGPFSDTVTFEANQTTAVITVNVVGDVTEEPDETLTVTLIDPNTNAPGASASATILNDDQTPELSIADVSQAEGNTGTTAFTVTVTRDGETGGTSTVTWTAAPSGDNPVDGADFVFDQVKTGTLTFDPGETTKDITFQVAGDTDVEEDETFTVSLSDAQGAGINPDAAEATVTIENDDTPVELSITALTPSQAEGDSGTTAFEFEVTRAGGDTTLPLTLDYRVKGDIDGDDIDGPFSDTVTFEANQTTAVITVNVVGDSLEEPDEALQIELFDPDGFSAATATATILNDDQAPELSIADVSQAEGNTGTTAFTVTVTRDGETGGTSTVTWTAAPSSDNPVDGADFVFDQVKTGTLTFDPGETTKDITFQVAGDTDVEPDETFTVTLSEPEGAGINPDAAEATVTIENDDTPVELSITALTPSQAEGDSGTTAFEFEVTRAGGDTTQALEVDYQVGGDIDGADIDGPFSDTVTFEANQTTAVITVNVVGDVTEEPDETLTVTLIDPNTNAPGASASATILNDDGLPTDPEDLNVIDGDNENNYLKGTEGSDLIRGFAGTDVLEGKDGNDILDGGVGTDVLYGGDDDDILSGGAGTDVLYGGGGNDVIIGGLDGDVIEGGMGNDTIFGGQGNDLIKGLAGNDILTGGEQGDTFFFSGLFGDDTITDFDETQDRLAFEVADNTNITAEVVDNGTLLTVESDEAMGSVLLLGVTDLNETA